MVYQQWWLQSGFRSHLIHYRKMVTWFMAVSKMCNRGSHNFPLCDASGYHGALCRTPWRYSFVSPSELGKHYYWKCMIKLGFGQKDGFDLKDHKKNAKSRKLCPLALIFLNLGKTIIIRCNSGGNRYSTWTHVLEEHILWTNYYLSRKNNLEILK